MSTSFSWSDTIQIAFSTCLPCITSRPSNGDASASTDSLLDPDRNNPTAHRIPRARPDELQGLLLDPDTDTEAERMSLHSNPGRSTRRNRKKSQKSSSKKSGGTKKRITMFGYDLFGKPAPPPIHLPESDDESTSALALPEPAARSSSGATFDSDAAPLDSAAIENLTGSTAAMQRALVAREAAQAEDEEERRRKEEKAERRAKRRERREMKRLAKALEKGSQASGEAFEGFQGSGVGDSHRDSYPGMPSFEGYGPFISARSPSPTKASMRAIYVRDEPNEDEDDADLDGQVYARRSRDPGNGSRSGSDSRSRTSASRSDVPTPLSQHSFNLAPQNQGFQPLPSPGMLLPHGSAQTPVKKPKSKSKTSSSKLKSISTNSTSTSRHSRSNTSASTSQSPSLPSPTSVTFGLVSPPPQLQSGTNEHTPTLSKLKAGHTILHEDDFDGSQGLTEADIPSPGFGYTSQSPTGGHFPSSELKSGGFPGTGLRRNTLQGSDFPSSGLGMGMSRPRATTSDSILAKCGAFLATRGDSASDERSG